jgi:hypothetical protein
LNGAMPSASTHTPDRSPSLSKDRRVTSPSLLHRASLLLLLPLIACESEAVLPDPNEPGPTGEVVIDASSTTAFTWVGLEEQSPVAVGDPSSSTAWDFGIRRYEVRLNGGFSGPGSVDAALVVNHASEPAATILAYTAEDRLAEFDAIDASDVPANSAFSSTSLTTDASSWFTPSGQGVVANPARSWKVRLADGGHAVLRIAELTVGGQGLEQFRIEYRLQATGGTLGSLESVAVTPGAPGSPTRISLESGAATEAGGCAWDLAIDAGFAITLNTGQGCNAGSFPLRDGESFEEVTTAADAPEYAAFLSRISSPIANSVTADDAPPFLYGLDPANPHRLVPSFNIYLIRSGTAVYKVQFLGYYNPAGGASGFPTLRVARIK